MSLLESGEQRYIKAINRNNSNNNNNNNNGNFSSAYALRPKALNKHSITHIMYIEMEFNSIKKKQTLIISHKGQFCCEMLSAIKMYKKKERKR